MYLELLKRLRVRAKREDEYYPHGGDIINEAADVIEELNQRIDYLMKCIYEAGDALDRGADNDWARAALEKAEEKTDADI